MNLQHVNVKIFVEEPAALDLGPFIDVFHGWVAGQELDEMLIDVADYRHVPAGPGVVLVGLQADYAFDQSGNRTGLCYNRKAPVDGSNHDRFRQALKAAAQVCLRLEGQFPELEFSRRELEFSINDRASGENTDKGNSAFQTELAAFFTELGHSECQMQRAADARARLGALVTLAEGADWSRFEDA